MRGAVELCFLFFFLSNLNTSEIVLVNVSISIGSSSVPQRFHADWKQYGTHKENEKPIFVLIEPQKWSIFRMLLLLFYYFSIRNVKYDGIGHVIWCALYTLHFLKCTNWINVMDFCSSNCHVNYYFFFFQNWIIGDWTSRSININENPEYIEIRCVSV